MQTQEKHSQAAVLWLAALTSHVLRIHPGSYHDCDSPWLFNWAVNLPDFHRYLHVWGGNIPPTPTQQILWDWTPSRSRSCLPICRSLDYDWAKHGSGAMFGALIASGIYVVLVSGIFSKVANLFPSIVTGSVITTIGLTLIPVAIGNMGNNVPEPTGQSLLLAAITVLIILLINIFTKGFIKSISILIGLVVGTAIAATMGLVDFSPVAAAPLAHRSQLHSTLGCQPLKSHLLSWCVSSQRCLWLSRLVFT